MSRDALVVGINEYANLNELQKPANDAEAIAQLLETKGGFRVKRLPCIEQAGQLCIDNDGAVGFKELQQALVQLFNPETDNKDNLPETVLLFFAGHGLREVVAGIAEGYLATSDTNPKRYHWGLSLDWLKKVLQKSQIKQQIVWLDCCYSGELLNVVETELGNRDGYERCLIAASRDYEVAYESVSSEHGVLTEVLLQGLAESESVDNYQLGDFIEKQLTRSGQRPLIRNFGRIVLTQAPVSAEKVQLSGICPYKGLRFFAEADAQYFYGREALTKQLIEVVRTSNFLAVLGVSGSGKSSVVRAGLLHQLRLGQHLGESRHWHICKPFTPAQNEGKPLDNLAQVLVADDLSTAARLKELDGVEYLLQQGATGLKRFIDDIEAPRVLLVIDQFEELFTRCEASEREQFLACILDCLPAPNASVGKLGVVVTLRADFLGKCAEQDYSGLNEYLDAHRVTVTPMTEAELSDAILLPAEAVGLEVEPELVTAMLQEVEGLVSLPLLEYSLTVLWEQRQLNRLTLADYTRCGGVKGTLQQSADMAYAALSGAEQAVAQWIFLGLTQLGEGTEDTRKLAFKSELVTGQYSEAEVDSVLDKLVTARLVVVDSLDSRGDKSVLVTVVDVAHEALIRHWGRLRGWLSASRQDLSDKREIERAARDWDGRERSKDYLLQGGKLAGAEEYVKSRGAVMPLTGLALAFVGKSVRYRQVKLFSLVGVVMAVILVLAGIAFYANEQRIVADEQRVEAEEQRKLAEEESQRAKQERNNAKLSEQRAGEEKNRAIQAEIKAKEQTKIAKARQLAAQATMAARGSNDLDGWPDLALLLAVQAVHKINNFETQSNLLRVLISKPKILSYLHGHTNNINHVAFSPDGKLIASGSLDNTIILWDVETQNPWGQPLHWENGSYFPGSARMNSVGIVAFSPDSKLLASGLTTITLWNVATQRPLGQPLQGHTDTVMAIAFSPDGHILASGNDDGIILWDVGKRQPMGYPLKGHSNATSSIAFSPDGQLLASGSYDGTVVFWDIKTHQPIGEPLKGQHEYLASLVFSPNDHILATGGDSGITFWDVKTRQQLGPPLRGYDENENVLAVAFSPDGKLLASGSGDILLWNVETRQRLGAPLQGHSDFIHSLAFSPDSKLLVSCGGNDLILWDIEETQTSIGRSLKGTKHSSIVSFSPDANFLATENDKDNKTEILIWDVKKNTPVEKPLLVKESSTSINFSADNKRLLTGSSNNTFTLFDLRTFSPINYFKYKNSDYSEVAVAFDNTGHPLIYTENDGTIYLVDIEKKIHIGKPLHSLGKFIKQMVISPNGKNLAVISDKTVMLWNLEQDNFPSFSLPIDQYINFGEYGGPDLVAFSHDGKQIAVLVNGMDTYNILTIWNIETQTLIGKPWFAGVNAGWTMAFSHDDKLLAIGGGYRVRGEFSVWDVTEQKPFFDSNIWDSGIWQPYKIYGDVINGIDFSPDGKWLATAGMSAPVVLWDIDPHSWKERACRIAGRNLTQEEWKRYLPDKSYQKTCQQYPEGQ
jgi:WD40 repeat protein